MQNLLQRPGRKASIPIPPPPSNTVAPVASGTVETGSPLSTTDGTWTESPTFAYQWQRADDTLTPPTNLTDIPGATSNSHNVLADDFTAGNVRCRVTGTNAGGSTPSVSNWLSRAPASTLLNGLERWYQLTDLLGTDATGGTAMPTTDTPVVITAGAPNGDDCIETTGGGFHLVGANNFTASSSTIAIWLNRDNLNLATQRRAFVLGSNDAGGNYHQMGTQNGFLVFSRTRETVGNVDTTSAPTTYNTLVWQCLLSTFDENDLTLRQYLNGVQVGTPTVAASRIFQVGSDVAIGIRPTQPTQRIEGTVSTAAAWNRVLTGPEITEFYNAGVNLKYADLF